MILKKLMCIALVAALAASAVGCQSETIVYSPEPVIPVPQGTQTVKASVGKTPAAPIPQAPAVDKTVVLTADRSTQSVYGTPTGIADELWATANALTEEFNVSDGEAEALSTPNIKTMWDETNLYVLVDMIDSDVYQSVDAEKPEAGDCFDLTFDFGNEKKADAFDTNDFSIKVMPDSTLIQHDNTPAGVTSQGGLSATGYTVQVTIPWGDVQAEAGRIIGFDAQINEGTTADAARVAVGIWSASSMAWKQMLNSGDLQLAAAPEPEEEVVNTEAGVANLDTTGITTERYTIATPGSPSGPNDSAWNSALAIEGEFNVSVGTADLLSTPNIRTMWDETNLYVLVDMIDSDVYQSVNASATHEGDCFDLTFDFGNEKAADAFDDNDFSIKVMPDGTLYNHDNTPAGTTAKGGLSDTGYTVQVTIPWGADFTAEQGAIIGFDAQINEGTTADAKRVGVGIWSASAEAWKQMLNSADLKLG